MMRFEARGINSALGQVPKVVNFYNNKVLGERMKSECKLGRPPYSWGPN